MNTAQTQDTTPKATVFPTTKRVTTPTLLQMEAVECGAAALGIILGYHQRFVPLEELRAECGVSRDGSKASNVLKAARKFGLEANGYRRQLETLHTVSLPMIVFWNFNHFLVVEGYGNGKVYLNDPASGPRVVSEEEFDQSFTGVVLEFKPSAEFRRGGQPASMLKSLATRFGNSSTALTFVVLVSLFGVIPGLVIPTFTRVFVDDVLVGRLTDRVFPLLIGLAIAALLQGVLSFMQQHYLLRFETKLALSAASKFFWHVLSLPINFFNQRSPSEIGNRVLINDRVARLLSGELATTVLNVLLIAFFALLMVQYDLVLTLIGITIALLNLVALRYVARYRKDGNQRLQQERGKLMGTAYVGLQLIETLKASGSESDFFARWSGFLAKVMNAEQDLGRTTQYLNVVPPLLLGINTTAILLVGGLRVMEGQMTIGMLVAFQALMASFLGPVNQLVNLGGRIQDAQADMNRLDDVLHYPVDPQVDVVMGNGAAIPLNAKLMGQIELRNITFGYSPLEAPLIQNFNLTIKPGMRVALVGGSGSGKSTVAKILSGLYQPWEGQILLDEKLREQVPRHILTNSIAVVDQDIHLFEGTVRDNLTLWDDNVPDHIVVQAAKDAHIHSEITNRSGGYDYRVDEGGRNFSGGQRQRLEIARALVSNPTVLILDEATSALDPVTEMIIDDHLRRRGCTCLIIAHRLSTIRDCDEILVLERGKIVQRGNHEQLRYMPGLYQRLIKAEGNDKESRLESILEALL